MDWKKIQGRARACPPGALALRIVPLEAPGHASSLRTEPLSQAGRQADPLMTSLSDPATDDTKPGEAHAQQARVAGAGTRGSTDTSSRLRKPGCGRASGDDSKSGNTTGAEQGWTP